jgi:glycosyltransferase involved in cell wall biosynthesis
MIIGMDARAANETQRAGLGYVCHHIICELLRQAPPDVKLRFYLDAEPCRSFPEIPFPHEIRIVPKRRFWLNRALVAALRADPPDVFYSPGQQIPATSACPRVATLLDLAMFMFPRHFTIRRLLLSALTTAHTAWNADHLVCISEATREDAARILRVRRDKMSVAHLGYDATRFRPNITQDQKAAVRAKRKLSERYILYVGRLQPRKNIVRLMDAFDAMVARQPGLPHQLVIAGGKGWLHEQILARAGRGAGDRIMLLDYVPDDELPALIAGAEVFALPSLYEGFGLPVLEAMACGTPVLTSDISSLPEVAGEAAVLVNPYDVNAISRGLEELVTNDTLRDSLSKRGIEQAQFFSWAHTAERVLQALVSVCRPK